MAGIDHALEGIPRYAGVLNIKKRKGRKHAFSGALFDSSPLSPSSGGGGSKFFLFFNNFFPQSHTHTNAL